MAEIRHRVGINGSAEAIYRLLTTDEGLARWWTTDTSGAGGPGSVIQFRFGDEGPCFEVVELVDNELVRWRHHGNLPEAWMETEICFRIVPVEGQTFVNFSHANWRLADDFLAHCSTKWAIFLMSLKSLMETGKGAPSPDDIKIDNWN